MPDTRTSHTNEGPSAINTKLFGLIMRLSIDERRALLAELEARIGPEQREYPRKEYFMVIQYAVGDFLSSGYIKDISSGGLFVETPAEVLKEISRGDRITLTFTHPNTRNNIKIQGEIVRIEGAGIGVNFDNLIPLLAE